MSVVLPGNRKFNLLNANAPAYLNVCQYHGRKVLKVLKLN